MKHLKLTIIVLLAALTACSKETTYYTVIFDGNGGQIIEGTTSIRVARGDKPCFYGGGMIPPNEKLGHRGWFREPGQINEWDWENDVVLSDMTLYAGWETIYTITYHANGGKFHDNGGIENLTAGKQMMGWQLYAPRNVTKPGFLLEGWYTDAALTRPWNFETDKIGGDGDLYAKWSPTIEGLTHANYPRVDGATSTRALNVMVACKLLGLPYDWGNIGTESERERCVFPRDYNYNDDGTFLDGHIRTSQSHGAMMNLIEGNADIILRSTTASPDEKAAAQAVGVTLIETPIALDAFVILKNYSNPVKSLTLDQVRRIYTKQITNWQDVGGTNTAIAPLTRPRNSGSEEAFRELVMRGTAPAEFPEEQQVMTMAGLIWQMSSTPGAIGYIFKNYNEIIAHRQHTDPVLAIDGVEPTSATMRAGTYALTTKVYAIIRADLSHESTAHKLYEWLLSPQAAGVLEECGFTTIQSVEMRGFF